MKGNEIRVDSREMISLRFRKHKHARYLYEEDPDGTIRLMPLALVPAALKAPGEKAADILSRPVAPIDIIRDYFPGAEEI